MHAQLAALIIFLVISRLNWRQTRMQFLVCLFMMKRALWAQWRLTGQESLFYWHIAEQHLIVLPKLIWLTPGAEAKLQCMSEKSCWMWMQKNTPVPRLNKGISCQEKGDFVQKMQFWVYFWVYPWLRHCCTDEPSDHNIVIAHLKCWGMKQTNNFNLGI